METWVKPELMIQLQHFCLPFRHFLIFLHIYEPKTTIITTATLGSSTLMVLKFQVPCSQAHSVGNRLQSPKQCIHTLGCISATWCFILLLLLFFLHFLIFLHQCRRRTTEYVSNYFCKSLQNKPFILRDIPGGLHYKFHVLESYSDTWSRSLSSLPNTCPCFMDGDKSDVYTDLHSWFVLSVGICVYYFYMIFGVWSFGVFRSVGGQWWVWWFSPEAGWP